MITCDHCGKLHPAGTAICDVCGTTLAAWPYVASTPLAEELGLDRLPPDADMLAGLKALSASLCPFCHGVNRPGASFCVHCGRTLPGGDEPPVVPVPGPGPGVMARAPGPGNLPVGTVLHDQYQIIRKVAQGGMGAVYEVRDLTQPGTRWAVKEMAQAVLHPEERTQALRDFMREATILATLQHPNLPTFNGFFSENNKHYLVMEYIAGRTLEQVVSSTRDFLPEARVMGWAAQLCDVLTYLHTQDPPIIYRDCKPGNVMLADGSEQVKLIDFGIARFHRAGRPATDEAFGTAGYAPPEQYGNGQTDQRADVYALAATLHHLLTGHDPGQNPFHWRAVRSYNPRVSRRVDMAILQALELKPELRFQSIDEFRQALGLAAVAPSPTVAQGAPAGLPVTSKLDRTTVVTVPESLRHVEPGPPPVPGLKPPGLAPAAEPGPLVSVSEKLVDLGPPGKRARQGYRVAVVNDGQGTLKGRVTATVPWISLNVREFTGDQVEVTISGHNRRLTPGHLHWPVPNLFAVLLTGLWRALTRSPLRGLLWLALIGGIGFVVIDPPVRPLLLAAGLLLVSATIITQVMLALIAWQVSWFVPAPRQHSGQVRVESNGGTRQIEVRMLARPGLIRQALGWVLVTILLVAELVALGWLLIYGTF
jgi:serine/threonine protein kinase